MKILVALCSVAFFLVSSTVVKAQQSPPSDTASSAAEAELVSLAKAWTDAINLKDRSKLDV